MSRILVLIPARAGSVRIPNKNKRLLGQLPLIEWTLRLAKCMFSESDVIVSTDDKDLLDIALEYGFYNSVLRPSELATSTSSLADVALNLTKKLPANHDYCGILLLQPTSPFRMRNTLSAFIDYVFSDSREACVAVSNVHTQPSWMYSVLDNRLVPLLPVSDEGMLRNLGDLVCVNGFAYYVPMSTLETKMTFLPEKSRYFLVNDIVQTIDIDHEYEFEFACLVAERIIDKCM